MMIAYADALIKLMDEREDLFIKRIKTKFIDEKNKYDKIYEYRGRQIDSILKKLK